MNNHSTVIYLDLDGTLIDVREKYCRLHEDIARAMGRQPLPSAIFWTLKRRATPLPALLGDWEAEARESYSRRWLAAIEAPTYLQFDGLIPGTRKVLSRLSRRHRLVLATLRRDGRALREQLQRLGIEGYFAGAVAAGDHPSAGSAKAQLLRLKGETNGRRAIVVGDSEADVEAARELGAPVVCVLTGIRDRPFLEALRPDHIIESVGQLPQLVDQAGRSERLVV